MTNYIIKENELRDIELRINSYYVVKECRSRLLSEHDAEIAKKERERVLDEVMGSISNLNLPCNMNPYDTVACIRGEIESLRGKP